MGSVTVTRDHLTYFGDRIIVYGVLSPSSSYATGGESYTAGDFALNVVTRLYVFPSGGYVCEVDHSNLKVKILGHRADSTSSGVIQLEEVSSGADLSSESFPFIAVGY